MRKIIIDRVNQIKELENNFSAFWWERVYFAAIDSKATHISEVDMNKLNDADLSRYFEYVLRMSIDHTTYKVKDQYFGH